jgi:hypothetical protein
MKVKELLGIWNRIRGKERRNKRAIEGVNMTRVHYIYENGTMKLITLYKIF